MSRATQCGVCGDVSEDGSCACRPVPDAQPEPEPALTAADLGMRNPWRDEEDPHWLADALGLRDPWVDPWVDHD